MKFDHKKELKKIEHTKEEIESGWNDWHYYEVIELSDGKKIKISESKWGDINVEVEDKCGRSVQISDHDISMKFTNVESTYVYDEKVNWENALSRDLGHGFFEFFWSKKALDEGKWDATEIRNLFGQPKKKVEDEEV